MLNIDIVNYSLLSFFSATRRALASTGPQVVVEKPPLSMIEKLVRRHKGKQLFPSFASLITNATFSVRNRNNFYRLWSIVRTRGESTLLRGWIISPTIMFGRRNRYFHGSNPKFTGSRRVTQGFKVFVQKEVLWVNPEKIFQLRQNPVMFSLSIPSGPLK
jgi:hypothetical protein